MGKIKYKTEEERLAARKLSVKKYNDKNKDKKRVWNKIRYEKLNIKKRRVFNSEEERKEAHRISSRKYRETHQEEIKEYQIKYQKIGNINNKKYYNLNKEKQHKRNKKYRENNREKLREKEKKYRENNKDNKNEYLKKRRSNDPLYKLKCNIRKLINSSIKKSGYSKKSRTHEILGCSYEEFKQHIEKQFEPWMNWDNYGNPKDGILELNKTWDVDHIIPLNPNDVKRTEQEIIELNHYLNLRPLCSYTNRHIKSNKLNF